MGMDNPFGKKRLGANIDAALAGRAPVVRDMMGRALEPGDEVVVLQPGTFFRVAHVAPVMDPGAPPNLMRLRCVGIVELVIQREGAVDGMVRTRTAAEIGGPLPPSGNGESHEPGEPPAGGGETLQ